MADKYSGEMREMVCPYCGKQIKVQVYPIINVKQMPQLRNHVLDESLFSQRCSECNQDFRVVTRCLYHDVDRDFLIYFIPGFREKKLEIGNLRQEYPEFFGAQCRVVSNLNQMKEKILLMESDLDDRAIEIAKFAISDIVSKKYKKRIQAAYFCRLDEETKRIGFTLFLDGQEEPVFYQTHLEIYTRAKAVAEEFPIQEFLCVDVKWAAQALDSSRKEKES